MSVVRSQVERGLFLWDGDMVMRQHERSKKIWATNQNLSALSLAHCEERYIFGAIILHYLKAIPHVQQFETSQCALKKIHASLFPVELHDLRTFD